MSDKVTVIAEGTAFEGTFTAHGPMIIDGKCKGEFVSQDKIVVGKTGMVEAEISTPRIEISGELVGNVQVDEEIIINHTGKLKGNILHNQAQLVIHKGGLFLGKSMECEKPGIKGTVDSIKSTA